MVLSAPALPARRVRRRRRSARGRGPHGYAVVGCGIRGVQRRSRTWGMAGRVLAGAAIGVAALALAAAAALLLTGHRATTMLTPSMAPAIPVGTLVVTEQVPAADLRPGDVIAFPRPDRTDLIYVHRVVAVQQSDGVVEVSTKGDANPAADPWVLRSRSTADRVVAVVPGGGALLRVMLRIALTALVVVVVGVAWLAGMRRLWRRR